jgi:tRNA (guanine26-N2/guanine27-N2)-dimethyltransferase
MGRKRARSGGDASCLDSSLEVVEEGGARCLVASSRARAPGSTPGFFNPKMVVNRDLVVAALAAAAAVRAPGLPPMRCLDAFCASGVLGLRWLAEVSAPLDVVLNDLSGRCAAMADENARAAAAAEDPSPQRVAAEPARASDDDARDVDPIRPTFPTRAFARSGSSARVTRRVADALLHESAPFDFVHLDPFGSAAPHLDAALARLPHGGFLSITATDIAALFGVYPAVARRRYGAETHHSRPRDVDESDPDGGNPAAEKEKPRSASSSIFDRPPWFRELGARILVGAAALCAARHDRGVTAVLSAASHEHFVHVVLRVERGAAAADASVAAVGPVWRCDAGCDDGDRCGGAGRPPCAHARALGPGWTGALGDEAFARRMLEAMAGGASPSGGRMAAAKASARLVARLAEEAGGPGLFRDARRFGVGMGALVDALRAKGFFASRTHFDPTGIRTDAPASAVAAAAAVAAARGKPEAPPKKS